MWQNLQLVAGLDDGGADGVVTAAGAEGRDRALVVAAREPQTVRCQLRVMELRLGDEGHAITLRNVERRQPPRDLVDDEAGGDGRAVVVKEGDELIRIDVAHSDQQHAHLRVAVLLDHKDLFVAAADFV